MNLSAPPRQGPDALGNKEVSFALRHRETRIYRHIPYLVLHFSSRTTLVCFQVDQIMDSAWCSTTRSLQAGVLTVAQLGNALSSFSLPHSYIPSLHSVLYDTFWFPPKSLCSISTVFKWRSAHPTGSQISAAIADPKSHDFDSETVVNSTISAQHE